LTAAGAIRAVLASRLGIEASPVRPDNLDQLFILLDQVTEADLEDRFGLVQTMRAPLTTEAIPAAKLRRWRQEHLRALWQQQDAAVQSVFGTPLPVIAPDIVEAGDFTNPTPANAVYALWPTRQQQVADMVATVKATREAQPTPMVGFERIISDTLGPIANLVALEDEHKRGNDITSPLLAKQLTLQPFLHLMRIRNLVRAGSVSDRLSSRRWRATSVARRNGSFRKHSPSMISASGSNKHALIVDQERFVASMQVEHADSAMEFLADKFTNADLFEWMSGGLERVYVYFLQQATAMAQLAQNAAGSHLQNRSRRFSTQRRRAAYPAGAAHPCPGRKAVV
jgi:hypothetical protein